VCGSWSLALREECALKMFENMMLKIIFGHRGSKWKKAGEDCIMRKLVTYTFHKILLG
jgi:hypothetical protein